MKNLKQFSLLIFVSFFLTTSCSKNHSTSCTIDVIIEPICAFNPKTAQTVAFPVVILKDGAMISHEAYDFTWSSDPDFKGSAISITYEQLPLTATVIEKSTGCETEVTLEKTYW